MKLTFTVDTDDMYGEEGFEHSFEELFARGLKNEIIKDARGQLASEKFAEFSRLTSDAIVSDIKLRMMNFLSEEIILTERYGEKTFVGSIEDLIKKRFDEILLKPVDGSGKMLQGCTSSGKTWIEWAIEKNLLSDRDQIIQNARANITKEVIAAVNARLVEFKDKAIKDQVDKVWVNLMKSEK